MMEIFVTLAVSYLFHLVIPFRFVIENGAFRSSISRITSFFSLVHILLLSMHTLSLFFFRLSVRKSWPLSHCETAGAQIWPYSAAR
jgi:hypothetical protein